MPQSVIKQVEDMNIKEYCNEVHIFTERNGDNLEVYNYDVNTHELNS